MLTLNTLSQYCTSSPIQITKNTNPWTTSFQFTWNKKQRKISSVSIPPSPSEISLKRSFNMQESPVKAEIVIISIPAVRCGARRRTWNLKMKLEQLIQNLKLLLILAFYDLAGWSWSVGRWYSSDRGSSVVVLVCLIELWVVTYPTALHHAKLVIKHQHAR